MARTTSNKGKLQVIFGPMFSGKTSELIRRVQRYRMAGYRCLVIRYKNDNRYSESSVITHDRVSLNAVSTEKLVDVTEVAKTHDVIGIDEGQFFPDIVEFCQLFSDSGKKIVVAALDGTYQKEAFGHILGLVPLAEEVVKLTAICMSCSGEAPFTRRIGPEREVEVIGSEDKYMSVCGNCYEIKVPVKRSPFKNYSGSSTNTI